MKRLTHIPMWVEAIMFAALVAGATALEIHGKEAGGLWFIIVLWVIFRNQEH